MTRRALLLIGAALAAMAPAGAAHAAAPASQRAALEDGTAILQVRDGAARSRVRSALAAKGVSARSMRALPMIAVRGSAAELRAAAGRPEVVAAHPDRRLALELWQGTPLVFGGRQAELAALGYDGRGVNIAIVDSGVDGLHRDVADHMVANHRVVADTPSPVVLPCPAAPNTCDFDDNGHGSHVTGIAAGDGTESAGFHTGIAPGAGIVGYAVGAGPSILFAVTAYDHILANPQLGVKVVNSSFGVTGGGRFDSADPVNQATKRLHAAGISVVFSNGNSGANTASTDPPGASDCSESGAADACKTNPYSVAPWVMSAAGGRKDVDGPRSAQHLSSYSARGDPSPQVAISGETIDYSPTITAPGTNVRSMRDPTATDGTVITVSNDPSAVNPPPGGETYELFYLPLTGTSMAAPALTGTVAVMQSAARARLGRFLTPAEVESIVTSTADPIGGVDALWDFPCGTAGFPACGDTIDGLGHTLQPYERWQVGAGYLDVGGAVDAIEAIPRGGSGTAGPVGTPACRDVIRPRTGLRYSGVKARRRRLSVSGRAGDAGCAGLRSVRVAVARRARGRCRFASPAGRLGRVKPCGSPRRYLRTSGGATWKLSLRRALRPGRYVIWARAVDRSGNTSRVGRALRLRLRSPAG